MTRRLYHEDATMRRFDAVVVETLTWKDQPAVVLDRTAFYPEAGGQLGDRGTLGGVAVLDTQERDGGTIIHVLASAGPAVGSELTGELDWARRRQHMAQHTAQHLLSGALLDRAAAPTVSARLGESALTIDVARDRMPEADLAAAEGLANDLIDDDLAIRAWFPDAAELAAMKLRRDPKVSADIRVIAIGDFDYSPCGGTHCSRTAQLGAIRILGAERYKGMTRVTFAASRRARAELFSRDAVLRTLATRFSCGPAEVPAAIDKLARDTDAARAEVTNLRGTLASMIAAAFPGDGPVVAEVPGAPELVRLVAVRLATSGRDALLSSPADAGTLVVLLRAAGSRLDCGSVWRTLTSAYGGRGGGKADRAEGRLATPVADWAAVIQPLLH